MKKILVLMVFVLGMMLSGVGEVKAQVYAECTSGYTQEGTYTINVGGCDFEVMICWSCNISNIGISLHIKQYRKIDQQCDPGMTQNQILEAFHDYITEPGFITANLCGGEFLYEPCDEVNADNFDFDVWYVGCWHKWKDDAEGYGYVWYVPCLEGSDLCLVFYKLCWNDEIGLVRYIVNDPPRYSWPSVCPTTPEPPDPINPGDETDCWHVSTPCG